MSNYITIKSKDNIFTSNDISEAPTNFKTFISGIYLINVGRNYYTNSQFASNLWSNLTTPLYFIGAKRDDNRVIEPISSSSSSRSYLYNEDTSNGYIQYALDLSNTFKSPTFFTETSGFLKKNYNITPITNLVFNLKYSSVIDVSYSWPQNFRYNFTVSGAPNIPTRYYYNSYNNPIQDIILQGISGQLGINYTDPQITIHNIPVSLNDSSSVYLSNIRSIPSYRLNTQEQYNPLVIINVCRWDPLNAGIENSFFNLRYVKNTSGEDTLGVGTKRVYADVSETFPFSDFSPIGILVDTSACYIKPQTIRLSTYINKDILFNIRNIFESNPNLYFNEDSGYFFEIDQLRQFYTGRDPIINAVPTIMRRTIDRDDDTKHYTYIGIFITQLPDARLGILQYTRNSGVSWQNVPQYMTFPSDTDFRFKVNFNAVTKKQERAIIKFRLWEPTPYGYTDYLPKTTYTVYDPPKDPGRYELDFSQQEESIEIEIKSPPTFSSQGRQIVTTIPIVSSNSRDISFNWQVNSGHAAGTTQYKLYVDGSGIQTNTNTSYNTRSTYGKTNIFYVSTSGDTIYSNTRVVNTPHILDISQTRNNVIDMSFQMITRNLSGDLSYAQLIISGSNNYTDISYTINNADIPTRMFNATLNYNSTFYPKLINYYRSLSDLSTIQYLNPITIRCPSGTTNLSGNSINYRQVVLSWTISGIKQTNISGYILYLNNNSTTRVNISRATDTSFTYIYDTYKYDISRSYNPRLYIQLNNNTLSPINEFPIISVPDAIRPSNIIGTSLNYKFAKIDWSFSNVVLPDISSFTIIIRTTTGTPTRIVTISNVSGTFGSSTHSYNMSGRADTLYGGRTYNVTISGIYRYSEIGIRDASSATFRTLATPAPILSSATNITYKSAKTNWTNISAEFIPDVSQLRISISGNPDNVDGITRPIVNISAILIKSGGSFDTSYSISSGLLFGGTTYTFGISAEYINGDVSYVKNTFGTTATPIVDLSSNFTPLTFPYKSVRIRWTNISSVFINDISNIQIIATPTSGSPLEYIISNKTDSSGIYDISNLIGDLSYNFKIRTSYKNNDISITPSANRINMRTTRATITNQSGQNLRYNSARINWTLSGAPPDDINFVELIIPNAQPSSKSSTLVYNTGGLYSGQTNSTDLSATISGLLGGRTYNTNKVRIAYNTRYDMSAASTFSFTLPPGNLQPISISGFNVDIITSSLSGARNTSTGILNDASNTGTGNYILHCIPSLSGALPIDGNISYNFNATATATSISGLWRITNVSSETISNNALMLSGNTISGTLLFDSPASYSAISVLGLASTASTIDISVNYVSGTRDRFLTTMPIYSGTVPTLSDNIVNISGINFGTTYRRVQRQQNISSTVVDATTNGIIRFYVYIMPTDITRNINSITIRNTTATSRIFILAVSGYT